MARKTQKTRFEVLEVTCNKCEKTFDNQEVQEALHYHDTGGYDSTTVGDGTLWSIDLCQTCIVDLLGPYIQKHDNHISGEFWIEKGVDAPALDRPVFTLRDGGDPLDLLGEEVSFEMGVALRREGLD